VDAMPVELRNPTANVHAPRDEVSVLHSHVVNPVAGIEASKEERVGHQPDGDGDGKVPEEVHHGAEEAPVVRAEREHLLDLLGHQSSHLSRERQVPQQEHRREEDGPHAGDVNQLVAAAKVSRQRIQGTPQTTHIGSQWLRA
jgi:hypothetical protein